jgi:hypothetical protein
MTYLQEWQTIKRNFETAAGRKKPSEKFMGVWKRSSGIEPITRDVDTALAARDLPKLRQAVTSFTTTKDSYQRTLAAATVGADNNVAAELKVMIGELELLERKLAGEVSKLDDALKALQARTVGWKAIQEEILRSPLAANADVGKFVKEKRYTVLAVTGKEDPRLAGYQATMRQKLADYGRALATIKNFKVEGGDFARTSKEFVEQLHAAQDTLTLNAGGMMDAFGEWSGLQRKQLQTASPQAKNTFENSEAWQTFNRANEALSAENERLAKVEQSFERQVLHTR